MKVSVKLVDEGEFKEFELPDDALVWDLKEKLAYKEGVINPGQRVRLYFKEVSGHELGMSILFVVNDRTFGYGAWVRPMFRVEK